MQKPNLLVQLMAHTFSLKLKFRKAGIIIVGKNRNISSVHNFPRDTICISLISLEVFLGASMIRGWLDIATALYRRAKNIEMLLEPKVNVNGHQLDPILLEDGINVLSKWLVKLYIFGPTLSAQENDLNKNLSSTRVNVERVFEILKVRWGGLLKTQVLSCPTSVKLTEKSIWKTKFYMKLS